MHRNILKNLLLQNHLAQMFEIWYVALPSAPLPSLFQMKVLGSKMTSGQETQVRAVEIHRKFLKNLLLQNHLAQMLEIRYEALPSSPLPILFK